MQQKLKIKRQQKHRTAAEKKQKHKGSGRKSRS